MKRIAKPETPGTAEVSETSELLAAPCNSRKRRSREKIDSVKITFHAPHELDFRLETIARIQKMKKGEFILKLLKQGCGSFKINESLLKVWGEIQGQDMNAA